MIKEFNLPVCTIPDFKQTELNDPSRVDEIIKELEQSQTETIILLGDLPIKHFLSYFSKFKKLSGFGTSQEEYGKKHLIIIKGKTYNVIPLVHPRQAGDLGKSRFDWSTLHQKWVVKNMNEIFRKGNHDIRLSQRPNYCPICGSNKIASYLYGLPAFSKKLENDIEEGKVILGGCCISNYDPFWSCVECKTDFHKAVHT